LDIDRAREINDARRIDEYYDEGATPIKVLHQQCSGNADFTIEQFIESGIFYGSNKESQNESARVFAEYIQEMILCKIEEDHSRFERLAKDLMNTAITHMEISL